MANSINQLVFISLTIISIPSYAGVQNLSDAVVSYCIFVTSVENMCMTSSQTHAMASPFPTQHFSADTVTWDTIGKLQTDIKFKSEGKETPGVH